MKKLFAAFSITFLTLSSNFNARVST